MDLIFVDEQTATYEGEGFTVVVAVALSTDRVILLKQRFYSELTQILGLVEGSDLQGFVHKSFPVLHGSELLLDYDDDTKIEAIEAVFKILCDLEVKLFRIGYFNNSDILSQKKSEKERRSKQLGLTGLWMSLWRDDAAPAMIVSEFDNREMQRNLTSSLGLYHQIGQESVSVPIDKLLGYYFALKDEVGCQCADLVAYAAYKSMSKGSAFHNRVGKAYEIIKPRFVVDQVIWLNDASRSFIRV